jgi:hypothetical protein
MPMLGNEQRAFESLHYFYGNLSQIAKEAVFLPVIHAQWKDNFLRIVQEQLLADKKEIGPLGETRKVAFYREHGNF